MDHGPYLSLKSPKIQDSSSNYIYMLYTYTYICLVLSTRYPIFILSIRRVFFKYHTGSKRMVFKLRFLEESNFQFVTNQKYQAVPSLDLLFWFIRLFSYPI